MIVPSSNPLSMVVDIFRAPTSCFAALYKRGAWGWQTYVLLMLTPFLFWGYYFDIVDFEWLKFNLVEQLQATSPDKIVLLEPNTLMASEILNAVFNRTLNIGLLAFWFSWLQNLAVISTVIGNGLRPPVSSYFQPFSVTLQAM